MAKDEDYKRMIHTVRWLRLRKGVLTRHPVCEMCEKEGILSPAVEVHHVVHCHVSIHQEMGKGTKAGAKERSDEKTSAACRKLFGEEGGGFF